MQVKGQGFSKASFQLENYKLQLLIEKLKMREKQVIAHEMAHKTVGGQYAGAVHYTYTRGPDGRYYITGGEVSIDVSPEPDQRQPLERWR